MDAVKYLKEKQRMCEKYIDCLGCPIYELKSKHHITCVMTEKTYPEKAVEIVEKWSEEHPQKTILQDFLEKYPNATLCRDVPNYCPMHLGYLKKCEENCIECWNSPLEG